MSFFQEEAEKKITLLEKETKSQVVISNDIIQQVLINKNKNIERNKFICANREDVESARSILEARGEGIPHAAFYDTRDKLSIFFHHITGFEEKYSSDSFGWRDRPHWNDVSQEEQRNAYDILKQTQIYLTNQGYECYLCFVNAHCKGQVDIYLTSSSSSDITTVMECFRIEEDEVSLYYDVALWVYTTQDEINFSDSKETI